ncbi:hypothetical protein TrVE_jg12055 [Triparma verrucosa]|uniref:Sm domain-containing protein n=1 Tax=Triparma verrucosa TaxID=1606542 RepID=A0A9W7F547_9STRA|nr:hypothetical protein TrVE_jg12055 [Triparma verrucosa]
MSNNPLIGNRISLISKKNIRYEGILYTINQSDSTVALKDVKSFGTEGRCEPGQTAVKANDAVHEYLLFRGQDIKDLHVHDSNTVPPPPPKADPAADDPAIMSMQAPPAMQASKQKQSQQNKQTVSTSQGDENLKFDSFKHHGSEGGSGNRDVDTFGASAVQQQKNSSGNNNGRSNNNNDRSNNNRQRQQSNNQRRERQPRERNERQPQNRQQQQQPRDSGPVGMGKSLTSRKLRGVGDGPAIATGDDFDLSKAGEDADVDLDVEVEGEVVAYSKDNFFDDLSCDQKDKANGVNNRLRGQAEKELNLEAFGAVSLGGGNRRGGRGNRRNRGGGGGGGRGRGRGQGGDNRRRGGRGGGGNNRYRDSDGMPKPQNQSQGQSS